MQLSLADTNKKIQAHLGTDKIELVKGQGYLYFVISDVEANVYETKSVYVPYLKDLSLADWMYAAIDFWDITMGREG